MESKSLTAANCEAKDRKSTRLNSSHVEISYAVFCLKKKKKEKKKKDKIKKKRRDIETDIVSVKERIKEPCESANLLKKYRVIRERSDRVKQTNQYA